MTNLTDVQKEYDKVQQLYMIKSSQENKGRKFTYFVKVIYLKAPARIIFNGRTLEVFPLHSVTA